MATMHGDHDVRSNERIVGRVPLKLIDALHCVCRCGMSVARDNALTTSAKPDRKKVVSQTIAFMTFMKIKTEDEINITGSGIKVVDG